LGLPVYESEINSVDGIARTLQELGKAMGTENLARASAQELTQQWQGLQQRYSQRAPVRVFVQLWGQPLMTVSRAHLINAAITACGGRNAFADLAALTPTVSWEAAVQSDPQVIVSTAGELPAVREQWARFAQVQAVQQARFVGIDGDLLTRMTPRFADAAQKLCEALDAARAHAP
jgi:iron complex transport system substrate-binding protein